MYLNHSVLSEYATLKSTELLTYTCKYMAGCDGTMNLSQLARKNLLACSSKYDDTLLGPRRGRLLLGQMKESAPCSW
jgi:hypothetical protein